MSKKLLSAVTVSLMTFALFGGTVIKYTDEQLKQITAAETYIKNADFKNARAARMTCIPDNVDMLKKMEQTGMDNRKYLIEKDTVVKGIELPLNTNKAVKEYPGSQDAQLSPSAAMPLPLALPWFPLSPGAPYREVLPVTD